MLFIKQGYAKFLDNFVVSIRWLQLHIKSTQLALQSHSECCVSGIPHHSSLNFEKKVLILRFVIFDMISVKNREAKEVA